MSVYLLTAYPDIKLIQEVYYPTRIACEVQEGISNFALTRPGYPHPTDFIEFQGIILQFIGTTCRNKIIIPYKQW